MFKIYMVFILFLQFLDVFMRVVNMKHFDEAHLCLFSNCLA